MSPPLAFSSLGHGPPLLILHGLFGSGRNWARIAKPLADQGWHVLTPDLRNHGRSPWHDTMTYSAMADDLRTLLAATIGDEPAVIIGHSMGGKAAMWLALKDSARVRALIPVDVAPVTYPPGRMIEACTQAMLNVPLDQVQRRADAAAHMAEAVPNEAVRAFLLQNLALPDREGGAARWRLNLRALTDSLPTLTGWPEAPPGAHYDGPALTLFGEASDYVRPYHRDSTLALFPTMQFEVIADTGHWVHAEAPTATLNALERFLSRV